MAKRVLVLRAGSAASNNLMRSLKAGDPSLFIVGCHDDRLILKKSPADRNYLVFPDSVRGFARGLRRIIETEHIDLLIPNSEADVTTISNLRSRLRCRTFLPSKAVIERCQDKYQLTRFLGHRGLPVPLTYPVTRLGDIEGLFRRFAPADQLWCRIRRGSGSVGAIRVNSPEQTRSWIKYWQQMRGVPPGLFTLSEYLPGRDFCVQCLLKDGKLIMAKMHERLSYQVASGGPSDVSSSAAVGRMIFEPRAFEVSSKAILTLDPKTSGIFFVDLKENAAGQPCITEINAGRFANVPTIHDLTGQDNMALTYVRLALGERVRARNACKPTVDYYVMRGIDMQPAIFRASELFEGIDDARV